MEDSGGSVQILWSFKSRTTAVLYKYTFSFKKYLIKSKKINKTTTLELKKTFRKFK